MELRQLRYFVAVAEERSFGRAAERLRISTPTLSQQVAVLERGLGVQLLDRRPHGVVVTVAGGVLLDQARHLLAASERLRDAVTGVGTAQHTLELRVGTGTQLAVDAPLALLESSPGVSVNLIATSLTDAVDAVLLGRADAAVVWVTGDRDPRLRVREVASVPVVIAVPESHRLAALKEVPVEELREEPLLLFPRHLSPGVYDLYVNHVLPHGPRTPSQVVLEPMRLNLHNLLAPVAAGAAVAPFVQPVAEALQTPGVALRPMDPPLSMPVELVWLEGRREHLDPVFRAFLPEVVRREQ